jgi:hypothetical protein
VIKIEKHELFDKSVEDALARDRMIKQRRLPDPPPVSAFRRLLNNPLFYLPLAAAIGVFVAWEIMPFQDMDVVGGQVMVVNRHPFIWENGPEITVDTTAFLVGTSGTKLLPGAHGEKAYHSVDDIAEGDYVEVSGAEVGDQRVATAIRPATRAQAMKTGARMRTSTVLIFLFFPIVALFLAFSLLLAEGVSSRNWSRMIERALLGTVLATVFATIALIIPGGIFMVVATNVTKYDSGGAAGLSAGHFITYEVCRSLAWSGLGAGLGVGLNLIRSTKAQLRNSVLGGTLGGAFGGALFDPINRFASSSPFTPANVERLFGVLALGVSIAVFVALVERLAREAWVRVRTGPLAGKAFVLYKTPTRVGSSPDCDIYLFKDAEIDGTHAAIHRVGVAYEIEDLGSRMGTDVAGQKIRRRRLASGDQITIGGTVLEFEERAKK